METKIAHVRAELYRVRKNISMVSFIVVMVALVLGGIIRQFPLIFGAAGAMVPVMVFFFLIVFSQAPLRIRHNKGRYSGLFGKDVANRFSEEWSDNAYPGWMARDYYRLVYDGIKPDTALNWICAKWMIFENWDSPFVIVRDKDDFPLLESFITQGISVSQFYRLWNMQLTSPEVMKHIIDNDLDSSLISSLIH